MKWLFRSALVSLLFSISTRITAQVPALRAFQADDLFRIRHIGAVSWSHDGRSAAIEITRSTQTLDAEIPSAELVLLNVKNRTIRTISPSIRYLGFFNPTWSPDGRRLAYLSVDANASVELWVMKIRMQSAEAPIRGLKIEADPSDSSIKWVGNHQVAALAWGAASGREDDLYFHVFRGRNVADKWLQAFRGQSASVSVLQSSALSCGPTTQLVVADVEKDTFRTLANGCLHNVSVSPDGRFIAFQQDRPGQAASLYFDLAASDVNKAYEAVNDGTVNRVIDANTGNEVSGPLTWAPPKTTTAQSSTIVPPRPDARRISESPNGDASLYEADALDGSHLWICGGQSNHRSDCSEFWHGNEWVRNIEGGTAKPVSYSTAAGKRLVGWLLLPQSYVPSHKLPVITIIYPGSVYTASARPSSFSLFWNGSWQAPQLFAALGYAVLLPSVPDASNQNEIVEHLPDAVIPAIDAIIGQGIANPDRIAIVGQSGGGFGVLSLITQTNRFRSAISSAGFSDLISLYGTFYGQYRYGDAGPPEKAQLLRMLQMEDGSMGLGGPPWRDTDRYLAASPILRADKVATPLMLIHGDIDFIPIQQDEEFFTALLRQNKPVEFVRYQSEWHTISARADVIDLWKRVASWLSETMTGPK